LESALAGREAGDPGTALMAVAGQISFVVEFVGLPGAGKSTLSHAVADALRASGEIISEPTYDITRGRDRRRRKAVLAARTLLRHPWLSVVGLRQIFATRQMTLRDFGFGAFNFLYICGLMEKIAREPGIHFLDQGYFNALWTIRFSATASPPLASLLRVGLQCCGRDGLDLVLLIEARPETVLARLRARPGMESRLEGRGGAGRFGARLDAALRALEQIRASLQALARNGRGRVRLETVDNDAPLGHQTEAVAAMVRKAWHSTACRSHRPLLAVPP
jgi:thymidylate kinase